MRRIRPRSAYDVLALVSFFLVIGGGTALASYVVSSNSQIGPGTVSGHKPPTGKHSNIIGGSVNGTDLSANSVNSSKVADHSLTGNDLALNNVSSALQVRTAYSETQCTPTCGSPTTLYTQGPWTLTGACVNDGGGSFHATVELSSSADAIIAVNDASGQRVATGNIVAPAQTATILNPADTAAKGGQFSAVLADATFNNHISGHVLAVADGGASDNNNVGFCKFAFEGLGQ